MRETPTLLGTLENATLNQWTDYLKTETDLVSETLFSRYLEFWKTDTVQKPSNSFCSHVNFTNALNSQENLTCVNWFIFV
jgi:hypothetical protein